MLTFYGHFSGLGSYPIVCTQLAAFLTAQGIEHRCVDLRRCLVIPRSHDRGPALLFGFPSWIVPIRNATQHEGWVGYHVCDVTPAPPDWAPAINTLDVCITASQWCASVLASSGVTLPVTVVRHGVPATMPRARRPLGSDHGVFLHFCPERSAERKGSLALIEAFERLDSHRLRIYSRAPEIVARVAASPRRDAIEVRDEDPVTDQAGQVRRFGEVDYVVQPSRAEGFGLVVGDALAAGVPVVATVCTGHAETLSTSPRTPGLVPVDHGALAPCSGGAAPEVTADAIHAALVTAIRQRAGMQAAASEHRRPFVETHAWERVLAPFLFALEPVLS